MAVRLIDCMYPSVLVKHNVVGLCLFNNPCNPRSIIYRANYNSHPFMYMRIAMYTSAAITKYKAVFFISLGSKVIFYFDFGYSMRRVDINPAGSAINLHSKFKFCLCASLSVDEICAFIFVYVTIRGVNFDFVHVVWF